MPSSVTVKVTKRCLIMSSRGFLALRRPNKVSLGGAWERSVEIILASVAEESHLVIGI